MLQLSRGKPSHSSSSLPGSQSASPHLPHTSSSPPSPSPSAGATGAASSVSNATASSSTSALPAAAAESSSPPPPPPPFFLADFRLPLAGGAAAGAGAGGGAQDGQSQSLSGIAASGGSMHARCSPLLQLSPSHSSSSFPGSQSASPHLPHTSSLFGAAASGGGAAFTLHDGQSQSPSGTAFSGGKWHCRWNPFAQYVPLG